MSAEVQAINALIGNDRLSEAADRLAEALEESPELQQELVLLKARIANLKTERREGVISVADADLKHNRIRKALLSLTEQLALPPDERKPQITSPRRSPWPVILLSLAAIASLSGLVYWLSAGSAPNEPFTLTAYLRGEEGDGAWIQEGTVQLRLAEYLTPAVVVQAEGKAIFEEIPARYRDDTARLVLVDMPYDLTGQSHYTAKESQRITFRLRPRSLRVNGLVLNPDGTAAKGSRIHIEGLEEDIRSDSTGRFSFLISRHSGQQVQVRVWVNGRQRFYATRTLSAQKEMVIQLNPVQ